MGFVFSKLWSMFSNEEHKVIIVGLDNAGKTTILYQFLMNEVVHTSPTIGSNVEEVVWKNIRFLMWDIGGQETLRSSWTTYYTNTEFVILVIDSTDRERLTVTKEELYRMLPHEDLKKAAILVFANKQDVKGAMSAAEISQQLNLTSIKNHRHHIQACCALTGKRPHPLVKKYEEARDLRFSCNTPPEKAKRPVSIELAKHMSVGPERYVSQLQADVALEKQTRKQRNFCNHLAQLGNSGSYQWPTERITSNPVPLRTPISLYTAASRVSSQQQAQHTYDAVHHPAVANNSYGYAYKQRREDRAYARPSSLHVNEEEMARPQPGLLTNAEYGRRNKTVYPNERHHSIHSHKSFYRNRGPDAS